MESHILNSIASKHHYRRTVPNVPFLLADICYVALSDERLYNFTTNPPRLRPSGGCGGERN